MQPFGGGGHRQHYTGQSHHRHHHHHGGHQHRQSYQQPSQRHPGQPMLDYNTSTKIPPSWSPEWEESYPFLDWTKDIEFWASGTDLGYQQIATQVASRLGGIAREMAREIDINVLRDGCLHDFQDGNGPRQVSGLEYLLEGLKSRFAPLGDETSMRALSNFMKFKREPGENIDQVLTRFDTLKFRAERNGQLTMGITSISYTLLMALHLSPDNWNRYLQPFNGN